MWCPHLNCKLLVPLSRERRPMLSTLELLSSLILLPVLRLLVLLHRRFQDCNQIHQRYHVMSREIRIEIRCHLAPRGRWPAAAVRPSCLVQCRVEVMNKLVHTLDSGTDPALLMSTCFSPLRWDKISTFPWCSSTITAATWALCNAREKPVFESS